MALEVTNSRQTKTEIISLVHVTWISVNLKILRIFVVLFGFTSLGKGKVIFELCGLGYVRQKSILFKK